MSIFDLGLGAVRLPGLQDLDGIVLIIPLVVMW
jgi:hypothetical protein